MSSDAPAPGSPADWIRYAKADLALAQASLPSASQSQARGIADVFTGGVDREVGEKQNVATFGL